MQDNTRQDKTRQNNARQEDKTRQVKSRPDQTRQDKTRQDKIKQDKLSDANRTTQESPRHGEKTRKLKIKIGRYNLVIANRDRE